MTPPRPWLSGQHSTYTAFRLGVTVCQDRDGNVWSEHDYLTPEDQAVADGMQYHAIPQIAYALLTEAVCREVYTSAMLIMSRDPQFLHSWKSGTPEVRAALEKGLVGGTQHVIALTTAKILPGAVAGVLTMLCSQEGDPHA